MLCKQRCQGKKHYWLKAKWAWQCAECDFRTSLRSDIVMEIPNLPIHTWYLVMALMSFTKKEMSTTELQRQLGHSRYQTVWSLMYRICEAMGKRDDLYGLKGMVEFDEGYFEQTTKEVEHQKLKRGSGF